MSTSIEHRLRIRNAADSADAIVITSTRGGTNPYISKTPTGDGSSFDPVTMDGIIGEYVGQIADWPIGSMQRVITSQLEDVNGKQQLGYRKAYWERSINGGAFGVLIAGVLTKLRLISGAEWEVAVTDPMRADIVSRLFAPSSTMPIANGSTGFLDLWPHRGCILGGPIIGASLGIADLGGWTMRVETSSLSPRVYTLRPVNVYGPPKWNANTAIQDIAQTINDSLAPFQIPLTNSAMAPWSTIEDTQKNASGWFGVTLLLDGVPWRPYPYDYTISVDSDGIGSVTNGLISTRKGELGLKIISDGTHTLTNGQIVRVRCITVLPTEQSPIYIVDHPVEVLKSFWTAVSMTFDSTACTALKSLIGTDAVIALRITDTKALSDIRGTICRLFGIGIRTNSSGQLVPFQARVVPNTPPTKTITTANVVKGSTGLPFELDPAGAIKSLTIRQKRFADQRYVNGSGAKSIVDGVVVQDEEQTFLNGDTTAIPFGDRELAIEGQVRYTKAGSPGIAGFGSRIAAEFFDRFGHGAIALETTLIRGTAVGGGFTTDDVVLGEELLINLPELPNANYRLGDNPAIAARAMQVVQLTEINEGYRVRVVDSGPNAQPLTTVPTLSIALSADLPRNVAEVTITNAAALNALGYGARLQWAATTGAAPSANQFTDVQAWPADAIPTGVIRLPVATAGATPYVQARSEGVPTRRPSNYGSTAHITLSAVNDPTGVTATPSGSDGSKAALAWTPGSGTTEDLVDIWLRLSGQPFSAAVKQKELNPGSVAFPIERLTPGTIYIASVQYRDPRTQDVSNPVDVTFTAGGTTRTLTAPIFPTGFAGSRDKNFGVPIADGHYGLAVVATEYPGRVEFAEAVETGVGTGSFGSFVTVGDFASVIGDWTVLSRVAPNDNLRRQLKARHVADGCTSSAYTAAITVTPWSAFPLSPFGSTAQGTATVDSNGAWQATADGPVSAQSWRYALSNSTFPSDATAAAGTAVAGRTFTVTGGPLTFGQTIYITAIPYSGTSGNGAAVGPSVHLRGAYQTFSSTVTTTYPPMGWTQGSTTGPVLTRTSTPIVVSPAIPASGLVEGDYVGAAVAQGAALQSIDFVCAWNSAAHPLSQFVFAVLYTSGGFGFVANGTPTYPGGLQTVHVSIGGTVPDSGKPVVFQALLFGPTSGSAAEAAQAELREVLVTTTAPNPAVRI